MHKKATWVCLLGGLGLVICGLSLGDETSEARAPQRAFRGPVARLAGPAGPAGLGEAPTPAPPEGAPPAGAAAPGSRLASTSFRGLPAALRAAARMHPVWQRRRQRPEPPLSLTATDGTGLQLLAVHARAAVEGPLALTELRLAFQNPRATTIEGRFEITLPTGATISRFAMRLPSGWQEAEVVERQAARQTYESYLHLQRDPALLEKKAGNTFRARVFPIPGRGVKQLLVAYSQQLVGARPAYRLRLRGLPKLRRLELTVVLGQSRRRRAQTTLGGEVVSSRLVRVSKRDYRPPTDFTLALPEQGDGLRHGNLVVARIAPRLPASLARAPLAGLAVLVDTSASRSVGLPAQVELLRALVGELARRHGAQVPLEVAAFDQGVEPIYRGPLGGFGRAAAERIVERRGLGASNLHAALVWARALRGVDRLVLLTDGVATAGPTATRALREAAKRLPTTLRRLDVLLVGGTHDRPAMQRLVTGTRTADGVVLDGEQPVAELAQHLGEVTVSGMEVQVAGARWVWPSVLDGVQPGQTTLIYADVPKLAAGAALTVQLSGRFAQRLALRLAPAARPLLEREWVRARIERLEHRRDALGATRPSSNAARELKQRIVALSTRYRVLSEHTAMIVLESEAEYARFKISRRALADVLAVGPQGVEVVQRQGVHVPSFGLGSSNGGRLGGLFGRDTALGSDAADALGGLIGDQVGESRGMGGLGVLGTIGKGGGAAGSRRVATPSARGVLQRRVARLGVLKVLGAPASSAGRPRLPSRPPQIRIGRTTVQGSLDKHFIRRVIRRHLNEVRFCYQRELQSMPLLQGRVVLRFVIDAEGQVPLSLVASSTLGHKGVERCMAAALRRWRFPRPPGGGTIMVNYPFMLRPALSKARWAPPVVALGSPSQVRRRPRPAARTLLRQGTAEQKLRALGELLARGQTRVALAGALRWQAAAPTHLLALLGLGQALEAVGEKALAARAYGSLMDLYPSRAAMLRHAAERLERLRGSSAALAVDAYEKALAQRPDHVTGYRLLAWAQLRAGAPASAVATLERAFAQKFPSWRNRNDWQRVLREDLGLIAAAWLAKAPSRHDELQRRLKAVGATVSTQPSLRFVLSWETDASDVDLHVQDARGGHAYYAVRSLQSGGQLYGDVTNGYGPEVFAIPGPPRAFPYRLSVQYFSRGAMGYGFGTVQVIEHDGRGGLRFDDRPFVVLDGAKAIALGTVLRAKGGVPPDPAARASLR